MNAFLSALLATHPEQNDLLRFADDGGRIPENDRIPCMRIGVTLRIRVPTSYRVTDES